MYIVKKNYNAIGGKGCIITNEESNRKLNRHGNVSGAICVIALDLIWCIDQNSQFVVCKVNIIICIFEYT